MPGTLPVAYRLRWCARKLQGISSVFCDIKMSKAPADVLCVSWTYSNSAKYVPPVVTPRGFFSIQILRNAISVSERILKNGEYLTELWSGVWCAIFGPPCICNYACLFRATLPELNWLNEWTTDRLIKTYLEATNLPVSSTFQSVHQSISWLLQLGQSGP